VGGRSGKSMAALVPSSTGNLIFSAEVAAVSCVFPEEIGVSVGMLWLRSR
jgi:hypothetical protein